MANRHSLAVQQTDTALACTAVSVATSTTAIVAAHGERSEITIVNDGANIIYLAFSTSTGVAPTAVANSGLRLASGASWTSGAYTGAVAGIALVGATVVTVTEF